MKVAELSSLFVPWSARGMEISMLLTGAQILIECLKEQGVDTIFGYPGGTVVNVYDALYDASDSLRHILTAHEQGACHAADGYARASGRTGVVLVTSGPGATNLVTGIATAYMDSVPLVAITVNVAVSSLGKDSFQEVDIAGITMPVTKHNFIVKDIEKLAPTIRRAFDIAESGRKGPVLIDITNDVTKFKTEYAPDVERSKVASKYSGKIPSDLDEEAADAAVSAIRKAKRPLMLLGGGSAHAVNTSMIEELADRLDFAVCETLMGKGTIDDASPRCLGLCGMHGSRAANRAVTECDLLLALGTRFSERVTANVRKFAPDALIVHVDIDSAELNKNVPAGITVRGDVTCFLNFVLSRIGKNSKRHAWTKSMIDLYGKEKLLFWQKGNAGETDKTSVSREENTKEGSETPGSSEGNTRKGSMPLSGPFAVRTSYEVLPKDAIVCTEVGQNQMWAAKYYDLNGPGRFLTSGGLGTMGFGLGAAIGAKLAFPDRVVINIAGDGCFRMNMNELSTASAYGLGVIELVLKNSSLGMVRQWQHYFFHDRFSQTSLPDNIDYCMLAKSMGCSACTVSTVGELKAALEKAVSSKMPCVIVAEIPDDSLVSPMVIPGASINDTID